jgi:hypothetical protein
MQPEGLKGGTLLKEQFISERVVVEHYSLPSRQDVCMSQTADLRMLSAHCGHRRHNLLGTQARAQRIFVTIRECLHCLGNLIYVVAPLIAAGLKTRASFSPR